MSSDEWFIGTGIIHAYFDLGALPIYITSASFLSFASLLYDYIGFLPINRLYLTIPLHIPYPQHAKKDY